MSDMKINSWNIKGLGNPIKRKKMLSILKKDNVDVAFLQETYLSDTEHNKLKRDWVGQVYFSSYKSHSRGTAILINKKIPFNLEKIITDPNGRFVLVCGHIWGKLITFLNIYAPNADEPTFMSDMVLLFNENCKGFGVMAGDFNLTMTALDKSNQTTNFSSRASKVLQGLCVESGLTDVWRELHQDARDYSFFSNVHNSYSRIDYAFVYSKYMYMIEQCEMSPIILSDHARICLTIKFKGNNSFSKQWKFDNSLLQDEEFILKMRTWIKNYIDENNDPLINPNTIWEAAKATLRGLIISYSSFKRRAKKVETQELEREIIRCEALHKTSATEENWRQLMAARAKINLNMSKEVATQMNYVRQKHYEFGNKPSKLLAHQLKKEQNERIIKAIYLDNNVTYHPKEINKAFFEFYNELYKSQSAYSQEQLDQYLENKKLPKLSDLDQQHLNSPFTKEEVLSTIKLMPTNKSPGPDGFSAEFYGEFWNELHPIFMAMVHNFCHNRTLPQSMNLAHITVLHKDGKDPLYCSSYRPISLLDHDYKIITKLIAKRLEDILPKLINPDQSGFIKGRYSADNIRRLLNVINHLDTRGSPSLLLALDAEKAFDRVEWSFLFSILNKLNMGQNFVDWIKAIYKNPKAAVITNGTSSDFFALTRGTRQGCPLSSSLFATVVEVLASSVRDNINIKGLQIDNEEHKISLYADDIILYIKEPEQSLVHLYREIEQFGKYSGYKINFNKSHACLLHMTPTDTMCNLYPFKWSPEGFKYLGVNITPRLENLHKENYDPLIEKIKSDLCKWSTLPLSLLGRINVIRMNVLPRLNFLFQMLPCYLPPEFFNTLNKPISKFIWSNKKPRIKLVTLMKPEPMGGLGLPNLQHYFWSAQLRNILSWSLGRKDSQWVEMEAKFVEPLPLDSLIFIKQFSKIRNISNCFTILHTLRSWKDCSKKLGITNWTSIYSPIHRNPDLDKHLASVNIQNWAQLGIKQFKDLFQTNMQLKSFMDLKTEYSIPNTDFF